MKTTPKYSLQDVKSLRNKEVKLKEKKNNETMKSRNKIENIPTIESISEPKENSLRTLIKLINCWKTPVRRERDMLSIISIRNKKEDIISDPTDTKKMASFSFALCFMKISVLKLISGAERGTACTGSGMGSPEPYVRAWVG